MVNLSLESKISVYTAKINTTCSIVASDSDTHTNNSESKGGHRQASLLQSEPGTKNAHNIIGV